MENVDLKNIYFKAPKLTTNVAMMLNWKNYFFEASPDTIKYPSTPTIPSHSNKSARIWVSCLFEAFFFQALSVLVKNDEYSVNKAQIATLLVPSIDTPCHQEFLQKCFDSALEKLQGQKDLQGL